MTKFTTILLAGVATLAFTGCGSGDSGSSSSYTAPVEDTNTIPLSVNGNQILVPGYTYSTAPGDTFEMYVAEAGSVLLSTIATFDIYDENYNPYNHGYNGTNQYSRGGSYEFAMGQYYLVKTSMGYTNMTVSSDVLIVPQ